MAKPIALRRDDVMGIAALHRILRAPLIGFASDTRGRYAAI